MTRKLSRKEAKRFGISTKQATQYEAYRGRLVSEASRVVGGQGARQKLKELSTHTYTSQVIESNDFSKEAYSKRSGNTAHGPVRARGKTDRDSVRYFAAKNACPIKD